MSTPALNINELLQGFFSTSAEPEKDPKYQIIAKIGQEMIERSVMPQNLCKDTIREDLDRCYKFLLPDSSEKDPGQLALNLFLKGAQRETVKTFLLFRLKRQDVEKIVPDTYSSPTVRSRASSLANALVPVKEEEL